MAGAVARQVLATLKKSVDEWGNGRALREYNQASNEKQHDQHGGQPPPFGIPKKLQELPHDSGATGDFLK